MPSPLISFAFPLQFGFLSWVSKVEVYIDFTIIKDINLRVLGQFPLLEKKVLSWHMDPSIFYNPKCGTLWWWCHYEELKFSYSEYMFSTYPMTKHMQLRYKEQDLQSHGSLNSAQTFVRRQMGASWSFCPNTSPLGTSGFLWAPG